MEMGHDEAAEVAERDNRDDRARRERWRTKDREIPYSALADRHLLNIIRLLQREAVQEAARQTAQMIRGASRPFGPQGDQAQLAFDAEFDRQLDKDWKSATGPEWSGLMKEARRRPAISAEAASIACADLRQAQLAVELRMMAKAGP